MLSRVMKMLFTSKHPIDNSQEIEKIKRDSHNKTQYIKNKSVARSHRTAKSFEETSKKVYDVAEKIYLATGQHK